jgi:short-subunit dehydrogenase
VTGHRGLALVTGASSGIGRAFAESLAAQGHPLLLVARRAERLRETARVLAERHGVEVGFAVADLSTDAGRGTCRDAIDAVGGVVDTVVLNAGFGALGTVAEVGRERQTSMVALNCEAVVDLACHVLPGMIGRGYGTVVVVSSAAAWQPVPFMATYAATKSFELAFAEALATEVRGTGVRAIAVCPGPTATEFAQVVGATHGPGFIPKETPEGVVAATWDALDRGRPRVATGWLAKITTVSASIFPRRVVVWGAAVVHRRLRAHKSD